MDQFYKKDLHICLAFHGEGWVVRHDADAFIVFLPSIGKVPASLLLIKPVLDANGNTTILSEKGKHSLMK